MHIKRIEVGILFALSTIVVIDGLVLTNLDRMRAGESGGYEILIGLILATLTVLYWFRGSAGEWTGGPGGRHVVAAFAILAAYAFIMPHLGYLLSTLLVTVAYMRGISGYRWLPSLAFAVVFAIGTAWFWAWLIVMVPQGILPWPEL
ncbi:MAG: tripartite tricarboxylate transporter TctB family protein [Rhodospirillales bacterium]|jgi:hypothetical protein|nr:tripartite tricarboxylate transporter TctB family protein [Rhodospirillales bacterium]